MAIPYQLTIISSTAQLKCYVQLVFRRWALWLNYNGIAAGLESRRVKLSATFGGALR